VAPHLGDLVDRGDDEDGACPRAVPARRAGPDRLFRDPSAEERLSLGGGWLFLIAAEAIASTDGLGYRIFLVRRYLAMDVIIPYVLWITLLGFTIDWSLRRIVRSRYRWYAS